MINDQAEDLVQLVRVLRVEGATVLDEIEVVEYSNLFAYLIWRATTSNS